MPDKAYFRRMEQPKTGTGYDWNGKAGGIATGMVVNALLFLLIDRPGVDVQWLWAFPAANALIIVVQLVRGQRRFAGGVLQGIVLLLVLAVVGYVLVGLYSFASLFFGGKIGG
ncbi:hypothetical protein GCM10027048_23080 [Hymenobacter coalescens]